VFENRVLRNIICTPYQFFYHQMKENEMGGVCGTDEIEEESTEGLVGNLKEINCLEDLCIDGKMVLK